jgi:hypothetical protein
MEQLVRSRTHQSLPETLSIGDGALLNARGFVTLDRTLEQCLLETQRQVHRLEEIVHRLSTVNHPATTPPAGALSLIQESTRRLQQEVDEFSLDSHAVLQIVGAPCSEAVGTAARAAR